MLQNEQTKLDVLYRTAQAEEWARVQRSREQAIADIGSLRRLPSWAWNETRCARGTTHETQRIGHALSVVSVMLAAGCVPETAPTVEYFRAHEMSARRNSQQCSNDPRALEDRSGLRQCT